MNAEKKPLSSEEQNHHLNDLKRMLMSELQIILKEAPYNEMRQHEIAAKLGVNQPLISQINTGLYEKFKVDRLIRMLNRLGRTVTLSIH